MTDLAGRMTARIDTTGDCWEWTGSRCGSPDRTGQPGYGQVWHEGRVRLAHRMMHELTVGPIPDGLQVDHLCSNKGCVNPKHLEAVTPMENTRRYWRGN